LQKKWLTLKLRRHNKAVISRVDLAREDVAVAVADEARAVVAIDEEVDVADEAVEMVTKRSGSL